MDSPSFCLVPWMHLHVWPNGDLHPCCMWNSGTAMGNVNSETVKDIYNAPGMKELRSNILEGKPSHGCRRCYKLEEAGVRSKRYYINKKYHHLQHLTQLTEPDGTLSELSIATIDVRFSNTCNLRCRMCGPALSTSWYADHTQAFGTPNFPKKLDCGANENFWQDFLQLLPTVEHIEFAGGEPLLDPRHWETLERLLELGRTEISLEYTTNFTNLEFQGRSVTELWRKFKNVFVQASLDASGERAEYLRKGTNWSRIEENRQRLLREAPNVKFGIVSTISVYNILHIPDFHEDWLRRALVQGHQISLSPLSYPVDMNICMLPKSFKKMIAQKYHLAMESFADERLKSQYAAIVEFMNAEDLSPHLKDFLRNTKTIDQIRGENFFTTFPEWKNLDYRVLA